MASCVILHELADPPPHLPLEEGDIVARRCPIGKVVSVQGDIVEISLGEDARLVRGERIFVCRDATPGTKEYVAEAAVEMIGEKSTACKLLPGRESRERMPIRRGDWALPHRTEFFNMDFRGAEEKEDDGAAQVDQGSVAAVGSVPKMN
jgi:hypothetical protein